MKMKKFFIILLPLAVFCSSLFAMEQQGKEKVELAVRQVTLSVKDNYVRVCGASGKDVEIFNLTGVKVSAIHIGSSDESIVLNLPRGCYILKVGNVVRKISIR